LAQIFRDMTEPQLRQLGNRVGHAVKAALPRDGMFVALFFDDSMIGQYVSNVERADMIKVLRETADRLAAREDVPR
jgi:hypothetical protein